MNIKKILSIFAFLFPAATIVTAQNDANRSLLWRIESKNTQKVSYLFGTIHLICPSDFIWTNGMQESFNECDKVCFEMNLADPMVMLQAAASMIDNSGKQLKDYFNPDQYKQLEKYFNDKQGMDLATMQQLKPYALQDFLVADFSGCTNPISYEDSLMKMAQNSSKKIMGLEEVSEQIAVLESEPIDSVIQDIMETINAAPTVDTEYMSLVNAYKSQNLPLLYQLIASSNELGSQLGRFLGDRNKKWISRMQSKMEGNSVFFAVGAGHLWGNDGVISLLRKQGYNVEPVMKK